MEPTDNPIETIQAISNVTLNEIASQPLLNIQIQIQNDCEEKSKMNHIRKCCRKPSRLVNDDDIFILTKIIETNWITIGEDLKLSRGVLDLIENECQTNAECVDMMLFRWIQWKHTTATLAKLSRVLYDNNELDAILALNPEL